MLRQRGPMLLYLDLAEDDTVSLPVMRKVKSGPYTARKLVWGVYGGHLQPALLPGTPPLSAHERNMGGREKRGGERRQRDPHLLPTSQALLELL